LKYKIDIEDIISPYVSLKRAGSLYKGLCPFHNEKTPSFTVYPDTQSFYCFGCGAGGDAITFIMKIENLDYMDALKLLADRVGLQMPQDGFDTSISKKRKKILEINRESARFFNSFMMSEEGRAGLQYFLNRGLTPKTIKKFGLGYAPNEWDRLLKHLKGKGFTLGEMLDAGLVKQGRKGYYDTFRNRVMTPIIDVRSNVIAFGGRVLDDSKPKYINSDDSLAYKKTNELFSLNFAKDSGKRTLILCEGYMDVIAMYQAGFTNAVASCGTALTAQQVKLISRYADEVILAYDADEAGQKAVSKAIALFKETAVKLRIPALYGGKDPDEIIKKLGREKFGAMLDGASNEVEFSLLNIRNAVDLGTTQGKIDFINRAVAVLANKTPVEKDLYTSRIAEELEVSKNSIRAQLENYEKRTAGNKRKNESLKVINDSIKNRTRSAIAADSTSRQLVAQERLLFLLINYPDCSRAAPEMSIDFITDSFIKNIYIKVCNNTENGLDNDVMGLAYGLTGEETARLSRIVNSQKSDNAKAEYADCVRIIKEEYKKKHRKDLSELSDDEFNNMFNKKR
ncbi:MAG: DNA primase, partial [Clostridiales bacterium]|nr:DNA primase [Clostridiales bacterium]